ncbi:MAG: cephalosporin hydroxylase family protein [Hyphomicrobiaceae bacterium]|nr:cephalosporin hydroxylase family protein [Hyphomicrobiaceae bacterium]
MVASYADDAEWMQASARWRDLAFAKRYMYNFSWLGRPIIQLPADMVAFQELVWSIRPDLIIETGIAHGGSIVLSASMLAMLDVADSVASGRAYTPSQSRRRVLGIDIDIRSHNRKAIEEHPFAYLIDAFEGSSIDPGMISRVQTYAADFKTILVCLDSNHTTEHVLAELTAYAPLTSTGSYCLVFDTVVDDLPEGLFPNRPWNKLDNPKVAVRQFLDTCRKGEILDAGGAACRFEVDETTEAKLLLSSAPNGYLRRVE